uniref:Uncharacterized protein n=1 Tax=Chromera velia CCMP2878 TaxID=1169474 RepID=A0A0G4HHG7_9ALVE|eukprot:Cvel_6815.t1-p1 / transcript=Cvel_6815.t1 / gene=Cvel_6815 / organism=Chromera_velia_CCMP2878 / gene_product=hypothetical protein / transcript_product=hypothetical protein / location=Cvel_scaffold343:49347-62258(+) / protein_length=3586 / sequence_SO=supercontig / SO=protein_coding / is_pseudo=false
MKGKKRECKRIWRHLYGRSQEKEPHVQRLFELLFTEDDEWTFDIPDERFRRERLEPHFPTARLRPRPRRCIFDALEAYRRFEDITSVEQRKVEEERFWDLLDDAASDMPMQTAMRSPVPRQAAEETRRERERREGGGRYDAGRGSRDDERERNRWDLGTGGRIREEKTPWDRSEPSSPRPTRETRRSPEITQQQHVARERERYHPSPRDGPRRSPYHDSNERVTQGGREKEREWQVRREKSRDTKRPLANPYDFSSPGESEKERERGVRREKSRDTKSSYVDPRAEEAREGREGEREMPPEGEKVNGGGILEEAPDIPPLRGPEAAERARDGAAETLPLRAPEAAERARDGAAETLPLRGREAAERARDGAAETVPLRGCEAAERARDGAAETLSLRGPEAAERARDGGAETVPLRGREAAERAVDGVAETLSLRGPEAADRARDGAAETLSLRGPEAAERARDGAAETVPLRGREAAERAVDGAAETLSLRGPEAAERARDGAAETLPLRGPEAAERARDGAAETVPLRGPEEADRARDGAAETVPLRGPEAAERARDGAAETVPLRAPEAAERAVDGAAETVRLRGPEAAERARDGAAETLPLRGPEAAERARDGAVETLPLRGPEAAERARDGAAETVPLRGREAAEKAGHGAAETPRLKEMFPEAAETLQQLTHAEVPIWTGADGQQQQQQEREENLTMTGGERQEVEGELRAIPLPMKKRRMDTEDTRRRRGTEDEGGDRDRWQTGEVNRGRQRDVYQNRAAQSPGFDGRQVDRRGGRGASESSSDAGEAKRLNGEYAMGGKRCVYGQGRREAERKRQGESAKQRDVYDLTPEEEEEEAAGYRYSRYRGENAVAQREVNRSRETETYNEREKAGRQRETHRDRDRDRPSSSPPNPYDYSDRDRPSSTPPNPYDYPSSSEANEKGRRREMEKESSPVSGSAPNRGMGLGFDRGAWGDREGEVDADSSVSMKCRGSGVVASRLPARERELDRRREEESESSVSMRCRGSGVVASRAPVQERERAPERDSPPDYGGGSGFEGLAQCRPANRERERRRGDERAVMRGGSPPVVGSRSPPPRQREREREVYRRRETDRDSMGHHRRRERQETQHQAYDDEDEGLSPSLDEEEWGGWGGGYSPREMTVSEAEREEWEREVRGNHSRGPPIEIYDLRQGGTLGRGQEEGDVDWDDETGTRGWGSIPDVWNRLRNVNTNTPFQIFISHIHPIPAGARDAPPPPEPREPEPAPSPQPSRSQSPTRPPPRSPPSPNAQRESEDDDEEENSEESVSSSSSSSESSVHYRSRGPRQIVNMGGGRHVEAEEEEESEYSTEYGSRSRSSKHTSSFCASSSSPNDHQEEEEEWGPRRQQQQPKNPHRLLGPPRRYISEETDSLDSRSKANVTPYVSAAATPCDSRQDSPEGSQRSRREGREARAPDYGSPSLDDLVSASMKAPGGGGVAAGYGSKGRDDSPCDSMQSKGRGAASGHGSDIPESGIGADQGSELSSSRDYGGLQIAEEFDLEVPSEHPRPLESKQRWYGLSRPSPVQQAGSRGGQPGGRDRLDAPPPESEEGRRLLGWGGGTFRHSGPGSQDDSPAASKQRGGQESASDSSSESEDDSLAASKQGGGQWLKERRRKRLEADSSSESEDDSPPASMNVGGRGGTAHRASDTQNDSPPPSMNSGERGGTADLPSDSQGDTPSTLLQQELRDGGSRQPGSDWSVPPVSREAAREREAAYWGSAGRDGLWRSDSVQEGKGGRAATPGRDRLDSPPASEQGKGQESASDSSSESEDDSPPASMNVGGRGGTAECPSGSQDESASASKQEEGAGGCPEPGRDSDRLDPKVSSRAALGERGGADRGSADQGDSPSASEREREEGGAGAPGSGLVASPHASERGRRQKGASDSSESKNDSVVASDQGWSEAGASHGGSERGDVSLPPTPLPRYVRESGDESPSSSSSSSDAESENSSEKDSGGEKGEELSSRPRRSEERSESESGSDSESSSFSPPPCSFFGSPLTSSRSADAETRSDLGSQVVGVGHRARALSSSLVKKEGAGGGLGGSDGAAGGEGESPCSPMNNSTEENESGHSSESAEDSPSGSNDGGLAESDTNGGEGNEEEEGQTEEGAGDEEEEENAVSSSTGGSSSAHEFLSDIVYLESSDELRQRAITLISEDQIHLPSGMRFWGVIALSGATYESLWVRSVADAATAWRIHAFTERVISKGAPWVVIAARRQPRSVGGGSWKRDWLIGVQTQDQGNQHAALDHRVAHDSRGAAAHLAMRIAEKLLEVPDDDSVAAFIPPASEGVPPVADVPPPTEIFELENEEGGEGGEQESETAEEEEGEEGEGEEEAQSATPCTVVMLVEQAWEGSNSPPSLPLSPPEGTGESEGGGKGVVASAAAAAAASVSATGLWCPGQSTNVLYSPSLLGSPAMSDNNALRDLATETSIPTLSAEDMDMAALHIDIEEEFSPKSEEVLFICGNAITAKAVTEAGFPPIGWRFGSQRIRTVRAFLRLQMALQRANADVLGIRLLGADRGGDNARTEVTLYVVFPDTGTDKKFTGEVDLDHRGSGEVKTLTHLCTSIYVWLKEREGKEKGENGEGSDSDAGQEEEKHDGSPLESHLRHAQPSAAAAAAVAAGGGGANARSPHVHPFAATVAAAAGATAESAFQPASRSPNAGCVQREGPDENALERVLGGGEKRTKQAPSASVDKKEKKKENASAERAKKEREISSASVDKGEKKKESTSAEKTKKEKEISSASVDKGEKEKESASAERAKKEKEISSASADKGEKKKETASAEKAKKETDISSASADKGEKKKETASAEKAKKEKEIPSALADRGERKEDDGSADKEKKKKEEMKDKERRTSSDSEEEQRERLLQACVSAASFVSQGQARRSPGGRGGVGRERERGRAVLAPYEQSQSSGRKSSERASSSSVSQQKSRQSADRGVRGGRGFVQESSGSSARGHPLRLPRPSSSSHRRETERTRGRREEEEEEEEASSRTKDVAKSSSSGYSRKMEVRESRRVSDGSGSDDECYFSPNGRVSPRSESGDEKDEGVGEEEKDYDSAIDSPPADTTPSGCSGASDFKSFPPSPERLTRLPLEFVWGVPRKLLMAQKDEFEWGEPGEDDDEEGECVLFVHGREERGEEGASDDGSRPPIWHARLSMEEDEEMEGICRELADMRLRTVVFLSAANIAQAWAWTEPTVAQPERFIEKLVKDSNPSTAVRKALKNVLEVLRKGVQEGEGEGKSTDRGGESDKSPEIGGTGADLSDDGAKSSASSTSSSRPLHPFPESGPGSPYIPTWRIEQMKKERRERRAKKRPASASASSRSLRRDMTEMSSWSSVQTRQRPASSSGGRRQNPIAGPPRDLRECWHIDYVREYKVNFHFSEEKLVATVGREKLRSFMPPDYTLFGFVTKADDDYWVGAFSPARRMLDAQRREVHSLVRVCKERDFAVLVGWKMEEGEYSAVVVPAQDCAHNDIVQISREFHDAALVRAMEIASERISLGGDLRREGGSEKEKGSRPTSASASASGRNGKAAVGTQVASTLSPDQRESRWQALHRKDFEIAAETEGDGGHHGGTFF